MVEIERKFLVTKDDYKNTYTHKYQIAQGYLNTDPNRTVRVRIKGEKAFITVKGVGNEAGITRFEWEKEISTQDATALLELCESGIIDKIRYEVFVNGFMYEVDEFNGDNHGLLIAEIELNSENQNFDKPEWLGEEVTGIDKYYNSYLSTNPYKNW